MRLLTRLLLGFLLFCCTIAQKQFLQPHNAVWDCQWKNVNNWVLDLDKMSVDHHLTRAAGTSGYAASVAYVKGRTVGELDGKLWMSWREQPFNHIFDFTRRIWLSNDRGENLTALPLQYNTATSYYGLTGQLVDTKQNLTHGSACFEEQWAGIHPVGKIVLIMRGGCPIAQKVTLALNRGALAVILYHDEELMDGIPGGSMGIENTGRLLPTVLTNYQSGMDFRLRLHRGHPVTVNLGIDCITDMRKTVNYIVETKTGNPDSLIVVGAHLDSPQNSPGINDNGSGVAALIEVVRALRNYYGFRNRVRFIFWGASFNGFAGSSYYVSQLSERELNAHRYYLDLDMVGANKPSWTVYSDTLAHKSGSRHIYQFLKANGINPVYRRFRNSSDYVPFLKVGIPCGGLFTGAGTPAFPCHGKVCDNKLSLNSDTVYRAAQAATYMVSKLALDISDVPRRFEEYIEPPVEMFSDQIEESGESLEKPAQFDMARK